MGSELVLPSTGEIINLEDAAQCARMLDEIKDLEDHLKEIKASLRWALLEESKVRGSKTLHFEKIDAVIATPVETVWDQSILAELQEAGLPEARMDELISIEISYKVNGLVAKSIAGSNPVYAEIIERAKTQIPKSPSVTVKRR